MTIRELREMIEEMPDEAQVFIMSQSSWPFENDLAGICVRAEMNEMDSDCDDDGEDRSDDRGAICSTDVFLCEGTQLRYGSKNAWAAMRTS